MNTTAHGTEMIIGNIRVQALGEYLARIEMKGPHGFEDRATFTVAERAGPPVEARLIQEESKARVVTTAYQIVVPSDATGLDGIVIASADGRPLSRLAGGAQRKEYLPSPSALPATWLLFDSPRVIPPAWGALPPPEDSTDPHSGWDMANDAVDVYVFFPAASGYERFRADFLRLTGSIPLVPLHTLGLWYSRYYPYSEESALAVVDKFRAARIPLDVFVADTDWRVGASCGYAINTELFPDMARFIRRAHGKNVRIMLNDHPEPVGTSAFAPDELKFRWAGLTSLLALGADIWWFDRNWHTHLQSPARGLDKEVWGMRLYHDVTQAFRPDRRPLIMSNVDGINNGRLDAPSHPAAHRFPVWWTGDTVAEWDCLRRGIQNGVDSGILSLLPYVHEDLGGHHGQTEPELYARFMQFGALSPVARIHCTTKVNRYPWTYGDDMEQLVGDYVRLRYRLLPMLYTAAYEAHQSGRPLLRRCDLEFPGRAEATNNTQYLLGDDLLVAPIHAPSDPDGLARRTVWIPDGEWENAWTGETIEGPATLGIACPLRQTPLFVRRGGLLLTAPQTYYTEQAVWNELTVEAFVPEGNQVRTRMLYEDDGLTTAHARGEYSLTSFALERAGAESRLSIAPQPAPHGTRPGERRLNLRLHLPRGCTVQEARVQGRLLAPEEYSMIAPAETALDMLFEGPGSAPAPESGPTFEWRATVVASEPLTLRLLLAPAP